MTLEIDLGEVQSIRPSALEGELELLPDPLWSLPENYTPPKRKLDLRQKVLARARARKWWRRQKGRRVIEHQQGT